MLIDDHHKPAGPIPARHCGAVFEIACQRQRVDASSGMPRTSAYLKPLTLLSLADELID
jgi:hypothetical protein